MWVLAYWIAVVFGSNLVLAVVSCVGFSCVDLLFAGDVWEFGCLLLLVWVYFGCCWTVIGSISLEFGVSVCLG